MDLNTDLIQYNRYHNHLLNYINYNKKQFLNIFTGGLDQVSRIFYKQH